MIERKTYRADIDRMRPKIFLLSLLATVGLFFLVLNIRFFNPAEALLENILDDVSIDMDMLPAMEQPDKNIIAAIHEEPKSTDKINKVDELVEEKTVEQVKNDLIFTPSEAGDAEQMKDSENEPIAPAITDMNGNDLPLRVVEQLPEFPGGMSQMMTWLSHALRYPKNAQNNKITGTVMVSFVVEKDGSLKHFRMVKSANEILNQEALRVLRMMPKWTPGMNHGKPCRTVVAVPIVFAL